jgi:hypothetical protein
MNWSKVTAEVIVLLLRVILAGSTYYYVTRTHSCQPFYRMYCLADPMVSVVIKLINLIKMHDRERQDRNLGFEMLRDRQ